ncbi:MAG: branched-chain amino acid transport system substrate-binding protein, partial [Chloroflexota bacterium]|nr:branched-chain amino acid transport system substrate-binding protein [Chloroflexota bacterium]
IAATLVAGSGGQSSAAVIRIGAVFPITSNAASLAGPELAGVQIAADLVNADGGLAGRRIELVQRNLPSRDAADAVMQDLKAQGVQLVIGAYSSDLSIAASQAADRAGLLYWESGAVADQLTGRGLPMTFRVGASGSNLGNNSATFAADELASRLGKPVGELRVAIAVADDAYATSVADAAQATAIARGMPVVARRSYNLVAPDWPRVMADLKAAKPDVLILASHIPDGIAFRQAMLKAGLKVGAFIGSTMAECDPDFAGVLGADAVGIFASDRPTAGFQPSALDPAAAATYARFATAWAAASRASNAGAGDQTGDGYDRYGSQDAEYSIQGPDANATSEQSEEALSGFTAAWALFHDVLPAAAASGGGAGAGAAAFDAAPVAAAARTIDLPEGSLPNGAGLHFSNDTARLGQNDRAAAVIWQWQAVRTYQFVWPPTYATGQVAFVPLVR